MYFNTHLNFPLSFVVFVDLFHYIIIAIDDGNVCFVVVVCNFLLALVLLFYVQNDLLYGYRMSLVAFVTFSLCLWGYQ